MVQEQYLCTCPKKMAMHLKEGKPRTIRELGEVAEDYVEAHAIPRTSCLEWNQGNIETGICSLICVAVTAVKFVENPATSGTSVRGDCQIPSPRPQKILPPPNRRQQWQTQQQKPALRCFLCNEPGHIARNCLIKPAGAAKLHAPEEDSDDAQRGAAAPKTPGSRSPVRNSVPPRTCRKHNWVDCGACLNPLDRTPHCLAAAMIAICRDCRKHHPVIADACLLQYT